jgi:hypothetical protein
LLSIIVFLCLRLLEYSISARLTKLDVNILRVNLNVTEILYDGLRPLADLGLFQLSVVCQQHLFRINKNNVGIQQVDKLNQKMRYLTSLVAIQEIGSRAAVPTCSMMIEKYAIVQTIEDELKTNCIIHELFVALIQASQ